ncbi:hypothetical protein [Nitrospirillum iridis]|uniref:Uncharacterized protein n=1 Tax=Nitrospirillum iridis TaxID=765888 RepID=A0A7X0B4L7_9PROT|nr:hypothetical protein [Nitrospirillum iridis]MBB6254109.1 hypothetical protein [Nitrospirillum iridis]
MNDDQAPNANLLVIQAAGAKIGQAMRLIAEADEMDSPVVASQMHLLAAITAIEAFGMMNTASTDQLLSASVAVSKTRRRIETMNRMVAFFLAGGTVEDWGALQ